MTDRELVQDVADTARWVAYHRALESERPDALFRDPFARQLAGERGRRVAEAMPPLPGAAPNGLSSALAVKTWIFDELILDHIRATNADAVLNLAAGLDARPYRLAIPRSVTWIEADRAALLEPKAEVLRNAVSSCAVERFTIDLADAAARKRLFDDVAARYARVIVVTEGLLVYLDEPLVAALASELRARPAMQTWILEHVAAETVEVQMRAWRKILARAQADWRFAPANGIEFFRGYGWVPAITRSSVMEARRLGREYLRSAWLVRLLSRLSPALHRRLERAVLIAAMRRL